MRLGRMVVVGAVREVAASGTTKKGEEEMEAVVAMMTKMILAPFAPAGLGPLESAMRY